MDTFRIQPIDETAVDEIVVAAGGARAHPDANRRSKPGADYLLGDALVELKALDDEGLSKPERQRKLADGFDSFFLWPLDYFPINANAPFRAFPELKRAWDAYTNRTMTALVRGELPLDAGKGPVLDTQFEVDGTTYVKPAPPMGKASEFYIHGRPRKGGLDAGIPPVALTFPDMTAGEWRKFREVLPSESLLYESYQEWRKHREQGFEASSPLKPFVPIQVTREGWAQWCTDNKQPRTASSVRRYANELFREQLPKLPVFALTPLHGCV